MNQQSTHNYSEAKDHNQTPMSSHKSIASFSAKSHQFTLSQLAKVPLSSIKQPVQSKIFIANQDMNPFVGAAAPLFSLMGKLSQIEHVPSLHALQQQLIHELKAFSSNALGQHYPQDITLIARFALCICLDTIIERSSWGHENWRAYRLVKDLHGEDWTITQFYQILAALKQDPKSHTDLLEFMYLCLSLADLSHGEISATEQPERDKNRAEYYLNEFYQLIREQRGQLDRRLSKSSTLKKTPKSHRSWLPVWLVLSITGIVLLTIFTGFNYILTSSSGPVYQQIKELKF